ncbi:hypothetical protein TNCT_247151 [Trichonephila clavata]|uniref:Uncharacterized protein n=1 Tax=Trichonephila clavata TaxID=2740835 RepID=A0A8X6L8W6_TRICU|nr:hypothetical protein TNCT_247151 [Trichonephila clavata]
MQHSKVKQPMVAEDDGGGPGRDETCAAAAYSVKPTAEEDTMIPMRRGPGAVAASSRRQMRHGGPGRGGPAAAVDSRQRRPRDPGRWRPGAAASR